jgi:hypothetical protein
MRSGKSLLHNLVVLRSTTPKWVEYEVLQVLLRPNLPRYIGRSGRVAVGGPKSR